MTAWFRSLFSNVVAPPAPPPVDPVQQLADHLDQRVQALVTEADAIFNPDQGSAKRHCVYATLQKEFPAYKKRDLSFAIENVIQMRHK